MKIFTSAPNEDRASLKSFFDMVESLPSKGHKIIDIYKNDTVPIPDDVEYLVKKYKQSERAIKESDVVLVDVTYPGRRVGFEIARALDERKFVIALYDEKGNVSARRIAPLLGNTSRNIYYQGYNEGNIKSIVEEGLKQAKDQMDTKFILIISPEIDKYLEWSSTERRMHKAQIVRTSIEDMMEKDKEYKQFVKELEND